MAVEGLTKALSGACREPPASTFLATPTDFVASRPEVAKLKSRSKNNFEGCHFEAGLIAQAVSCYLRYPLSYREIEELLLERGLVVDHSTVNKSGIDRARSAPSAVTHSNGSS